MPPKDSLKNNQKFTKNPFLGKKIDLGPKMRQTIKRPTGSREGRLGKNKEPKEIEDKTERRPLVTDEELEIAFKFLDTKGKGVIKASQLKKRLSMFYKHLPPNQLKILMDGANEITMEEIKELFNTTKMDHFDPVKEAFNVYDPKKSGHIHPLLIKEILHDLNITDLSDEDLAIFLEAADYDKDGRIGLMDFRMINDGLRRERDIELKEQKAKEEEEKAEKLRQEEEEKKQLILTEDPEPDS